MMLAKSLQSAAGNAAGEANYIEDVFSTWLYTGNGSTQTITNGIDLAGEGGLVWAKNRADSGYNHALMDTARSGILCSNTTQSNTAAPVSEITTYNSNGFTLNAGYGYANENGRPIVSWTFRKQPKFFDVVTYTGDGTDSRNISHNLGTRPGFIVVKRTDSTGDWFCGARSGNSGSDYVYQLLKLNSTAARAGSNFGSTDTTFNVAAVSYAYEASTDTNINGATYVAYLFAHDAGGFGLTGTDNVISCGSYTGTGALNNQITLGYEPQLVIVKAASISGESWWMLDNMRGMPVQDYSGAVGLRPNTSDAEVSPFGFYPTATGFVPADTGGAINQSGVTYIYIAIRRGPMKTPTTGTSVFIPNAQNAVNPTSTVTTNFPVDMSISAQRTRTLDVNTWVNDRLRGSSTTSTNWLQTSTTNAELNTVGFGYDNNTGYVDNFWGNPTSGAGAGGQSIIYWNFRRAPGFFDEVCYTGTGVAGTVAHNLGVAPELMIVKKRNSSSFSNWSIYNSSLGANKFIYLDLANGAQSDLAFSKYWNSTNPTSTVFYVGDQRRTNESGSTYVAYLFASCPGVSKVGSYTGTGTTQQINCGFTGGARFVMIKRTDSTGDWYVWDSARGIVAGNDPYLLLNSTAAEVTSTDYVDTYSAGFEISSTAPAAINASGGTFIFLAIA